MTAQITPPDEPKQSPIVTAIVTVFTPQVRQYLLAVFLPIILLLGGYGVIDGSKIALWTAVVMAVFGQGMSLTALTAQRRSGLLP